MDTVESHNRGLSLFSSQACQIKWPREAAALSGRAFNVSVVIKRRCVESEKGNRAKRESLCVCGVPETLVCLSPTCSTWGGRGLRGSEGK